MQRLRGYAGKAHVGPHAGSQARHRQRRL